jgi:lysophospholipase L1-like esterase
MLSFTCIQAQQKTSPLFPADSTIQSASTSVIVYARADENADKLISVLNKKGVPVIKADNRVDINGILLRLRTNATAHKVVSPQIGIVTLGETILPPSATDSAAFIGMIDPGNLPKLKIPLTMPLFIDRNSDNHERAIHFYSNWIKKGGKADLHLHQPAVADSVQNAELINWLGGLGFLKPISNEKTEAQKRQQDWVNFMKMIDDRLHNDWAWLKRYEEDNEKMPAPAKDEKRVVFLGNSITEGWINKDPEFFQSHKYINRGIGGQTTPQMLVRFREDVVNLRPHVVIILAGINDIAGNTGPSKLENVAGNIISMAEIAKANGIKVILCSVLPAIGFPWHPGIDPVPSINKLNAMLKTYANKNRLTYVDYYSAVVDDKRGFKKELAIDGVHPNLAGYKILEPLAEAAINKTLSGK